ncbi:ABC transporter permease [Nonomuraea turcica]|uniref:ABC transporter permease n=1 Tax=Nonomuraea sp. G32 TaxID=3067274 RepID=UPI00273C22BE|nr:ABC transporter permease [Nonomuraea sp. G32]MDP4501319.1 ABC transporter permease [Nonomuraea sp. G32]
MTVLRGHPGGALGAGLLAAIVIGAVLAPLIAPFGLREKAGAVYQPPSWPHPLGLDDAGVDMVTLLLWGARTSLLVGFAAALIAVVVGGAVGLIAGYAGGRTDAVLMRVTDYMLVIPDIPLLLIVAAIWGRSMTGVILIIGLLSWPRLARVVRAEALSVRERAYVQRALTIGAGSLRIVGTHVLPHVTPLLLTLAIFAVGNAILVETAVAFLGLGDPSAVSWGRLIQNAFAGQAVSRGAWWAIVPPGLAVGFLILSCTLIGRALEDHLNPRLRSGYLSVRTFRVVTTPTRGEP